MDVLDWKCQELISQVFVLSALWPRAYLTYIFATHVVQTQAMTGLGVVRHIRSKIRRSSSHGSFKILAVSSSWLLACLTDSFHKWWFEVGPEIPPPKYINLWKVSPWLIIVSLCLIWSFQHRLWEQCYSTRYFIYGVRIDTFRCIHI